MPEVITDQRPSAEEPNPRERLSKSDMSAPSWVEINVREHQANPYSPYFQNDESSARKLEMYYTSDN